MSTATWMWLTLACHVVHVLSGDLHQYFTQNDYCRLVCNGYTNMCMPEYLDPKNTFKPHCEDEHQSGHRPNEACAFCIRSQGLHPNAGVSAGNTQTIAPKRPNPQPFTTRKTTRAVIAKKPDKCYDKCGNYNNICLPRWLDSKKLFMRYCEDTNGVGMPSNACILCLKIHGIPVMSLPTTTPTFTTSTTKPSEFIRDPCRERCLDYTGICLPEYLDPFNWFQPHCEAVNNVARPPMQCLQCLKTFPITPRPATTEPATGFVASNPTKATARPCEGKYCNVDPCVMMCGNYHSLCMPKYLDPGDVFYPHCENTKGVGLPSSACLACIRQNGLTSTTIYSTTMRTTRKTTPIKPWDDPCYPMCNGYTSICLPSWLDPWHLFSPHCEDAGKALMPSTDCVLCLKIQGVTPTSVRPTGPPTNSFHSNKNMDYLYP